MSADVALASHLLTRGTVVLAITIVAVSTALIVIALQPAVDGQALLEQVPAQQLERSEMPESTVVFGECRVSLEVRMPRSSALDEPLVAEFVITNVGARPVQFMDRTTREVGIRVHDEDMRGVPKSTYGIVVLKPEDHDYVSGELSTLAPGESHSWQRDLNACFRLHPGKFTAQAWVDVMVAEGDTAKYVPVSAEVSFEIREP